VKNLIYGELNKVPQWENLRPEKNSASESREESASVQIMLGERGEKQVKEETQVGYEAKLLTAGERDWDGIGIKIDMPLVSNLGSSTKKVLWK